MSDVSNIGDTFTLHTLMSIHDLGPGPVEMNKIDKYVSIMSRKSMEAIPYLTLAADGYITIRGQTVAITDRGTNAVLRMREELLRIMKQER